MPRIKRPLAEVDTNVSRLPPADKRVKTNAEPPKDKKESTSSLTTTPQRWKDYLIGCGGKKEQIDYETKDNSKLRRFLLERGLPTSGSRDELLARLEQSSINYDDLLSEQLTEMLKGRHITNSATGSKAIKIERLRLNDKLARDTGTHGDGELYAKFDVTQYVIADLEKTISNDGYSSKTPRVLNSMLTKRKLSTSGSIPVQIARLRKDDRKRLDKWKKEYIVAKQNLEKAIGRTIDDGLSSKVEDQVRAEDYQMEKTSRDARPKIPICDYEWRNSHWASRTERQLREICERREYPGYGPKAAMIKWLETGTLDYQDLYTVSLERMCRERGIHTKHGEKKDELVRLLKEADEADETMKGPS